MASKEEQIKNYYKKKAYKKYEAERKEKYRIKCEQERKEKYRIKCEQERKVRYKEKCDAERKEKILADVENKKERHKNIWKELRQESLCTYGNYKSNVEKAFHNCFKRAKNFKGYIDEFKNVIEKSFKEGMNWDNYGKWEIDHIIPLAKEGEHSVNNIQALWKKENRSKGSKIINIILNKIRKKKKEK
jgi:5-methylcytosine-specific restriction endonuclease McrA